MDNINPPSLTKTCISCGIEKPLSAFLELSGEHSGSYGSICGTCRKENQTKAKPKETEGGSRSSSGEKIDSKAKIAGDIDKKESLVRKEEEYFEERDENALIENIEIDKKGETSKNERKHRETFLGTSSFLDRKKIDSKTAKTHFAVSEETQEQQNISDNVVEEQKKTDFDFTGPVQDTYIAGKQKYQGVAIRQFAALIGKGSAIGQRLGPKTDEPTPAKENDPTLSEQIDKNWGPGSRRR